MCDGQFDCLNGMDEFKCGKCACCIHRLVNPALIEEREEGRVATKYSVAWPGSYEQNPA